MAKKFKIDKGLLIFWCLFIGIGAVAGAIGMFVDLSGKVLGMDALLPYFQVLPFSDVLFQNFLFSGIMLLIVNGLTNLAASILILMNKKIGILLGTIFGITLMMWIIIQFVIFPINFMSTIYFIFGFLQFITGYVCFVRNKQCLFVFDKNQYTNIGENKDTLVVYFSRTGYTEKVAYEKANEIGADILKIETTEKVKGVSGFMWCGRFGMHRWGMPLKPNEIDLKKYKKVIICSPVWVFSVCAPIRQFCKDNASNIEEAEYVFVHFMKAKFQKCASSLDSILNIKRTKCESVCVRMGEVKKTYNC